MSDEHYYEGETPVVRLRVWALGQMIWGALLAGVGVAIVAVVLLAIWGVSLLLPEESKQAPSPYTGLEISQPVARIV
jgi:hypothetical protein